MTYILNQRQKQRFNRIVSGPLFSIYSQSEWQVFIHIAKWWQIAIVCFLSLLRVVISLPLIAVGLAVLIYGIFNLDIILNVPLP